MDAAYEGLVKSGAISSLKRDILLEASADLYYLVHIRRWFAETAGEEAAKSATACTIRVVRELVTKDLCKLATWEKYGGPFKTVEMSDKELEEIVERHKSFDTMPFDYFLVATPVGERWVAQYEALAAQL